MVEAARRVVAGSLPHAGLELLFTPKEEVGLRGAAAFDCSRFVARVGYVYDQAAPIGEVVLGAPYARSMDVRSAAVGARRHGPEEGRSAIAAAARAIADMRLGRLDEETTANVGTIDGRRRPQHRPRPLHVQRRGALARRAQARRPRAGDARACTFAATLTGCEVETKVERATSGYRFRKRRRAGPARASRARARRLEPSYTLSGGGADANIFNMRGLAVPQPRERDGGRSTRPQEHIAVADLEGMVDVTLALLEEARAP